MSNCSRNLSTEDIETTALKAVIPTPPQATSPDKGDVATQLLREELGRALEEIESKDSMLSMLTEGLKEVEISQAGLISANEFMSQKIISLESTIEQLVLVKEQLFQESQLYESACTELQKESSDLKRENNNLKKEIGEIKTVSICC